MPAPAPGVDFRRLRRSSVLGGLAEGAVATAFILLAADLTRDPVGVAAMLAALHLPWALVALVPEVGAAGADRRTTLGAAATVRAVAVGATGVAALLDRDTLTVVLATAAAYALAGAVADDAERDSVGGVVDRGGEPAAASSLATRGLVGHAAGVPVGGLLFSVLSPLPFLSISIVLAVAALFALAVRRPLGADAGRRGDRRGAGPTGARNGLRVIAGDSLQRTLTGIAAGTSLLTGAVLGVIVLFSQDRLGLQAMGFGLLLLAAAAGQYLGALAAPTLARTGRSAGGALVACLALAGVGYAALPHGPGTPAAVGALAFASAASGAALVMVAALRHAAALGAGVVPAAVHRANHVVAWTGVAAGAVGGGFLVRAVGLDTTFVAAGAGHGALALVAVGAALILRRRRRERAATGAT